LDIKQSSALALAHWAYEFAETPISPAVARRIEDILLDSIACAFSATDNALSRSLLKVVGDFRSGGPCSVIGTRLKTNFPLAAFASGSLIRMLDFNDTYSGPDQIGHPSDILGAAFAAGELADGSGAQLQRAIRLGYEIYGRVLDLTNPETDWDHVTASGISSAAMAGWLMGLPPAKLANAIALSATHSATLGEVRVGKVSSAKSIASAVVVQTAALMTALAAEGFTGPVEALEGRRGYSRLLLRDPDFAKFFALGSDERVLSTGLKPYPCFALGQGPISAAVKLRAEIPTNAKLERVDVAIADTAPARLRLSDQHGKTPESREAADHSLYVLMALAFLDGYVVEEQFLSDRWSQPDVLDLVARINVIIDRSLQPARQLPCRVAAHAGGQSYEVSWSASPGNPANPLPRDDVEGKFRRCVDRRLSADDIGNVIQMISNLHELDKVSTLTRILRPR
jgi:2-methylcitrate dehydratase